MSATCSSRENETRLRKEGAAGADVLDLLEIQACKDYYDLPPPDAVNLRTWETSKRVLELKLADKIGYGLDLVAEIKELAALGSSAKPLQIGLYAVLIVANNREPEKAPLRLACTIHIGGMIPGETDNSGNCYELIEHAVELFDKKRKFHSLADCLRLDFIFQGEQFYFTAALTADTSLLKVFTEAGCGRIQAVV